MAFSTPTIPKRKLTQPLINLVQVNALLSEELTETEINANPAILFNIGVQRYNQKNYREALAAFDQALELKPDFVEAQLNRGATFLALGDYPRALENVEKALELKPDYADAWSNKGAIFEQQGQYEDAILAFDQAINCQPSNSEFWYGKGYSLLHLGRYADSIVATKRSIQLQGHNYDAWLNLGVAEVCLNHYHDAVDTFDHAIAVEQNRPDAWLAKGLSLLYLKRYDDAISAYSQTIALKPELSKAWYNRACAYGLQGNAEKTIEDLSQAIALYSDWQETAKTEPDFALIRDNNEFQQLLHGRQTQNTVNPGKTQISEPENPWMKVVGKPKNNPLFDNVLTETEAYCHETDSEILNLDQDPEELAQEMRVAAAVKWYELGQMSQGKAAEISGLTRAGFINALARYQVSPFQYTAEELIEELADAD